MLAAIGFITVIAMLVLIMTKKLTPTVALILVPFIAGIIASFFIVTDPENAPGVVNALANIKSLGAYIVGDSGMKSVAATGVMFIFSVLFFSMMSDAGAFKPIINGVLKVVGVDPVKICIGPVAIGCVCHLDGSGATTFLIAIPALLPLYDALGMKRTTLATLVALAAGTMNILPWGGPTIRAATAAGVDVMTLFSPMLIPVLAGLTMVIVIAIILGKKEKAALGIITVESVAAAEDNMSDEEKALLRPKLFWVNLLIIVLTIVALVKSGFNPAVVFMIAFCVGMLVNYPNIAIQKKIVNMHAQSALMMASVLFAAGAFIGIMKGTGMISAMASALVSVIPASMGHFFPLIVGIIAMPASLLFDPDSFYYGVLPVLMETGSSFGVTNLDIARAAITGQMTLGFPVSPLTPATFLLMGLAGVELGEHQKHTLPWAWLVSIVILVVAIVVGAITI